MSPPMKTAIARACEKTAPQSRPRMKALASVRWVLATDDGRFVKVDSRLAVTLTRDPGEATIYDGRDNEELKCRFMQVLLGVQLAVVLLNE
jgi:hypothetical protein